MATSGNDEYGSLLRIEKFKGENFHLWKFKMQMVLEEKDLWNIVKGDEVEPAEEGTTETQRRQFQKRERKALATICLSLGDEQLSLVRTATTAKQAWSKLESHYEIKSLANKLFLRKKYFTMSMAVDDSMSEHINKMKELASQLEAVGASITEDDQVATLLCSLPESYNALITALESRADDLKLEFVTARLLHEEHKRKENLLTPDAGEKALLSKHDRPNQRSLKPKRKGKCHNCGIPGHWARECRKPKKEKPKEDKEKQDGASYKASCSHASFWSSKPVNRKDLTWYIDSGASQHMSYDKEMMVDYVHFENPQKVCLGDNRVVQAFGKGNIWLDVKTGNEYKPARLVDVLYVPDLAKNLFSVSAAAKRGYSIELHQSGCVILDKFQKISGSGKLQNNLYVLDVNEKNVGFHDVNIASNEHPEELWHQRFGHLSKNNLRLLRDQKLVTGMDFHPAKESEFCEGCAHGKQKRASFPKGQATRASEIIEIVHSDVCGPMQENSLGGNRYFVTFIDDKSRFTAVYFMKTKDQVLEKFKEYEAMVTNMTEKKIKILRSDNGGEYTSKEFSNYLKEKGIQHQLSVPRTPQQNGVAERMNRTIQETARSMMYNAGQDKKFWAEAVCTAVIIRNRSPTVAVDNMTPYECFYGIKPDVSHFKVFGCKAYMHVPKENRKKWDSKTKKCIFVGYSITSKGYRLYDPVSRKICVSRDVLFDEDEFIQRKKEIQVFDTGDSENEEEIQEINEPMPQATQEDHDNIDNEESTSEETDVIQQQQPRRSTRKREPPDRHGVVITGNWWENNVACSDGEYSFEEPTTVNEALNGPDNEQWKRALDNEYSAHIKNNTWTLTNLPKGRKAIDCRWVFKVKYKADGSVERHKARLVAKGCSQKPGLDYEETFSPVAKYTSIRTLLAIANQLNLEVHQMDVSTAFLNGKLEEEIYMSQPEGYVKEGEEELVCKLNKSIYGLKQSSRCWFNTIDEFLENSGYTKSSSDPCIYIKREGEDIMLIALYVDDLIPASNSKSMLLREKAALRQRFEMKDLGEVHYCLGIQVERDKDNKRMRLHQAQYLENLLEKFGMQDCKPAATPVDQSTKLLPNEGEPIDKENYQALIGGLTYAVTATRPDLAQALGTVNQFCSNPGEEHWKAAKRILRYIKGTIDYGITFDGNKETDVELKGYVDADWGSNPNGRKSHSGYLFTVCGGVISWASKKQSVVALSSTEAEYVAASLASQEAIWLRALLGDISFVQKKPTVIKEDNQGTIALSRNPKYHPRTKHIDIKYHFIRDKVAKKELILDYCPTEQMLADLLTKPLGKTLFQRLRGLMGVKNAC